MADLGPIEYLAPTRGGGMKTRRAWPTTVPGLVVGRRPSTVVSHCCPGPCWKVIHVRSGRRVAHCLVSPEQAGYIAERLAPLLDWTLSAKDIIAAMTARKLAQRIKLIVEAADGVWRPDGPSPVDSEVDRRNATLIAKAG